MSSHRCSFCKQSDWSVWLFAGFVMQGIHFITSVHGNNTGRTDVHAYICMYYVRKIIYTITSEVMEGCVMVWVLEKHIAPVLAAYTCCVYSRLRPTYRANPQALLIDFCGWVCAGYCTGECVRVCRLLCRWVCAGECVRVCRWVCAGYCAGECVQVTVQVSVCRLLCRWVCACVQVSAGVCRWVRTGVCRWVCAGYCAGECLQVTVQVSVCVSACVSVCRWVRTGVCRWVCVSACVCVQVCVCRWVCAGVCEMCWSVGQVWGHLSTTGMNHTPLSTAKCRNPWNSTHHMEDRSGSRSDTRDEWT